MKRNIIWFRRDLRLGDNPALLAAIENSDEIVPLFILDPNLIKEAGNKRLAYLANSLHKLDESLGGKLHIVAGNQVEVLKSFNAKEVHISKEFEPYGAARDQKILDSGINLVATGSPYAVAPGRVRKPDDTNYRVYTPFYKGWMAHGWREPAPTPKEINAVTPSKEHRQFPDWKTDCNIPEAGEAAALSRFEWFKKNALDQYDQQRNMAGIDGTSRMSAHLKFGEIHPRTLLKGLGLSSAHDTFRKEIAWREFYADVLFHNPHTIDEYYSERFAKMRYNKPDEKFIAWCEGKTGYPFVDAAMRQLVTTGWMHNRTRMVVASFLVKDLHIEWQHGANFFMEHLVDYDPASNSHGWQWTAGCGTDASPYYRVFNPIEQGRKFDPDGEYIRKYIPELANLSSELIHEPGLSYIAPIVDHKVERMESLARLEEIKE